MSRLIPQVTLVQTMTKGDRIEIPLVPGVSRRDLAAWLTSDEAEQSFQYWALRRELAP